MVSILGTAVSFVPAEMASNALEEPRSPFWYM